MTLAFWFWVLLGAVVAAAVVVVGVLLWPRWRERQRRVAQIQHIDPARLVLWVEAALLDIETAKGASCPLRSIPIDLVADAVRREAAATDGRLARALERVIERYCKSYLPPRLDLVDRSDIFSPGGMLTPSRIERD